MRDINVSIEVAATTPKTVYIPVPCRGVVAAVYAVYNQETDEDEVFTLYRDSTAVNVVTPPADATAAGVSITGVPDATNKGLVFDPASTTAANRVIKVGILDTVDSAGVLGLHILFDDSAFVAQAAKLA